MIVQDLEFDIDKMGPVITLAGIADTHFLCDSSEADAYQPLDVEAYNYLKYCMEELRSNPKQYGKIVTYTGGDLTELERSSVRKVMRTLKKNDTRAQDSVHKRILHNDILPKMRCLVQKTQFIGGVAGNHLIEFSDQTLYPNSEAFLIGHLKGKYCGESKLLLNIRFKQRNTSILKKVIITHGNKGGNKAAIIRELQQIYYMYGKIDLIVKCHAHDPSAGFFCKYDLPDTEKGHHKKQETLVMCLGSTRDGEKVGYDDYSERFNYAPCASRFPMAIFHCSKRKINSDSLGVNIRPLIM
jgi:hypothetical protein